MAEVVSIARAGVPLQLALFVALLAAVLSFLAGRMLVAAWADYKLAFQNTAEHNLAQLFLFIDPRRLFYANTVLLLLVFFVVLGLGGGPMLAVLSAAVIGASPPLIYWFLHWRRRQHLVAQLPDALLGIATSMRSGLSVNQAIENAVVYEPAPLSQELSLVLRELRVGMEFSQAVDNLYRRVPEVEVQLVSAAMKISREVGGNLSEALERISDTLRKRLQMEGKIRSLTAQGKLQGIVMTALPLFLVFALTQLEPRAMWYLFNAWYGWAVIAVIVTLEVIGYHFIRRIVSIDV